MERDHFEEYVSKFGEARFSDFAQQIQDRDFVASTKPEEWKFVERLLPLKLKPIVPNADRFPSGFQLPKIRPSEAIEKYGYFVNRNTNHMVPVYTEVKIFPVEREYLETKIKHVDGNLFKLKEDLDKFLMDRFGCEFISQVSEIQSMIMYKGDLEAEFKEFILDKGF